MRALVPWQRLERTPRDAERQQAERYVDPENEAPVQMLGEHSAEYRARDRGEREDSPEVALIAATLARADRVADDRLRHRDQAAAAEALDGA